MTAVRKEEPRVLYASARPIVPGRTERAMRLADELRDHRAAYDALNARYRIRRHVTWVSHLVDGTDLWANVYDMEPEDLAEMRRRRWDPDGSAYDRWWLEWCRDVLGLDLLAGNGLAGPPDLLLDWAAEP
jgi:hypothetical protein